MTDRIYAEQARVRAALPSTTSNGRSSATVSRGSLGSSMTSMSSQESSSRSFITFISELIHEILVLLKLGTPDNSRADSNDSLVSSNDSLVSSNDSLVSSNDSLPGLVSYNPKTPKDLVRFDLDYLESRQNQIEKVELELQTLKDKLKDVKNVQVQELGRQIRDKSKELRNLKEQVQKEFEIKTPKINENLKNYLDQEVSSFQELLKGVDVQVDEKIKAVPEEDIQAAEAFIRESLNRCPKQENLKDYISLVKQIITD